MHSQLPDVVAMTPQKQTNKIVHKTPHPNMGFPPTASVALLFSKALLCFVIGLD